MYLRCPRQYRYRYVDQIPTLFTGALAFGQAIHGALHKAQMWGIEQGEPPSEEVAYNEFLRLWEKAMAEQEPSFKDDGEIGEYLRLAKLMICGYAEAHRERPTPILVEYPFELTLETAHDATVVLQGIIDRVEEDCEGMVIVDYKTGKRKPSPRQLRSNLQLAIYALAATQIFEEAVTSAVYYHLRDQTLLRANFAGDDLRALEEETLPGVAAGIALGSFEPRVGYWCRFCDYRTLCLDEGPDSMP
jgi:RecB family exonuclease